MQILNAIIYPNLPYSDLYPIIPHIQAKHYCFFWSTIVNVMFPVMPYEKVRISKNLFLRRSLPKTMSLFET